MESATFKIDELSGHHTAKLVKQTLNTLPGVTSVSINQETDRVVVDFDSTGVTQHMIKNKLIQLGLGITAENVMSSCHRRGIIEAKGGADVFLD